MILILSQMAKHREMQLLEEPLTNYNNGRLLNSRTPRDGRYREVKLVHLLFSCFVVFLVCEFKPHTLRMASNILEKGSSSQVSLGTFPLGTWHLALGTWHLRLETWDLSNDESKWERVGSLWNSIPWILWWPGSFGNDMCGNYFGNSNFGTSFGGNFGNSRTIKEWDSVMANYIRWILWAGIRSHSCIVHTLLFKSKLFGVSKFAPNADLEDP